MKSRLLKGLIIVIALPALIFPTLALGYILYRGLPELGVMILLDSSSVPYGLGGQIIGSLLLMIGAFLIATPVALGLAVWLQTKPQNACWLDSVTNILYLLQGIPPIVYGLCGLVVLVQLLDWGISLLAGVVVLAAIILPMLTLNFSHILNRIPPEYTEAGFSLGLGPAGVLMRIWLPAAWQGLVTAILLSLARTLSETAPILFTATVFSGVIWPASWFSPVTTLQTHIFFLAQEGLDAQAINSAWAAAVILIGLISLFSLAALWLRYRHP